MPNYLQNLAAANVTQNVVIGKVLSFLFFKDFYLPLHRCEVYLALFSNVIFIISHKVLFGNSGTQRKEE